MHIRGRDEEENILVESDLTSGAMPGTMDLRASNCWFMFDELLSFQSSSELELLSLELVILAP